MHHEKPWNSPVSLSSQREANPRLPASLPVQPTGATRLTGPPLHANKTRSHNTTTAYAYHDNRQFSANRDDLHDEIEKFTGCKPPNRATCHPKTILKATFQKALSLAR